MGKQENVLSFSTSSWIYKFTLYANGFKCRPRKEEIFSKNSFNCTLQVCLEYYKVFCGSLEGNRIYMLTRKVSQVSSLNVTSLPDISKNTLYNLHFFFSIWVFFHEHSRFIRQQGKGEGIYLSPLYHFHPLHRHLDISREIAAESSPLHISGSRTRTGNLWFPSASR